MFEILTVISLIPTDFVFGSDGIWNRIKLFAGGLYVLFIGWYFLLVLVDNRGNEEFTLLQSRRLWLLGVCVGTIFVSVWVGYSEGGLLVAVAVGLVFPIVFATLGVVLTILRLNDPDAYLLPLAGLFVPLGLIPAIVGFVIGTAIRIVLGS